MAEIIILMLYLSALIILALYSAEAIYLTFIYLRHRNDPELFCEPVDFPYVTVQLPIFNERYVAQRLIHAVCALDYPKEKLHIQILDDSTDRTAEICLQEMAVFSARGFEIEYIHRRDREGYKAGALRKGLETAQGELVAIFDADFIPPPDFLIKTIPHFADEKVGMVQTRWDHLNEEYSMITRVQAFGLAGHFIVEQKGRNAAGLFINFNGTAGVWRKKCIKDSGNWQSDTLTEDLDLSYRAQLRGWKFIFLSDVVTPAELPAEINALKSQQYRWTKGAVETAQKLLPYVWKSQLPLSNKIHATFHLTNNIVYPFILLIAILNLPVILIKTSVPDTGMFFVVFTIFLLSFWASFFFYAVSHKAIYEDWFKRLLIFPVFMAGSMGLAINNTYAVIEAILGKKSAFVRTPKYGLIGKAGSFVHKQYIMKLDRMVLVEIIMAAYSCVGLMISIYHLELGILPFMIMFFFGFGVIAYLSLKHYFLAYFRRS